MEFTTEQKLIIVALAMQDAGYLAAPHASCFAQFQLDDNTVSAELLTLAKLDPPLVQLSTEYEDVYVIDEEGDEQLDHQEVVQHGWEITADGLAIAPQLRAELEEAAQ